MKIQDKLQPVSASKKQALPQGCHSLAFCLPGNFVPADSQVDLQNSMFSKHQTHPTRIAFLWPNFYFHALFAHSRTFFAGSKDTLMTHTSERCGN